MGQRSTVLLNLSPEDMPPVVTLTDILLCLGTSLNMMSKDFVYSRTVVA